MPNHVTSTVVITGPEPDISAFRTLCFVKDKKGDLEFDFKAIIPMPDIINPENPVHVEESSHTQMGAEMIIWRATGASPFQDQVSGRATLYSRIRTELNMEQNRLSDVIAAYFAKYPAVEEQGKLMLRAIVETGYASWYEWSVANWGTKWGAYNFDIKSEDPLTIRFDTAWSFPTPIFEKLVEKFPTLTFDVATFDEGWNFAGEGLFGVGAQANPFRTGNASNGFDMEALHLKARGYAYVPEDDE